MFNVTIFDEARLIDGRVDIKLSFMFAKTEQEAINACINNIREIRNNRNLITIEYQDNTKDFHSKIPNNIPAFYLQIQYPNNTEFTFRNDMNYECIRLRNLYYVINEGSEKEFTNMAHCMMYPEQERFCNVSIRGGFLPS